MEKKGGARGKGTCIGGASMPQPSTLRLILNAAALAAASLTLLLCDVTRCVNLDMSQSDRRPDGEDETCPGCFVAIATQWQ